MNPYPFNVNDVKWLADNGNGDMGDVTDADSKCRFQLDVAVSYTLIGIRGGFEGGTQDADLSIRIDSRRQPLYQEQVGGTAKDTPWDFTLRTIANVGMSSDGSQRPIMFRLTMEEILSGFYTLHREDVCVLEWTNPQSGTIQWAVEPGFVDSSRW